MEDAKPTPLDYGGPATPPNRAAFFSVGFAIVSVCADAALWMSRDTGGNTAVGMCGMSALAVIAPMGGIVQGVIGSERGRRDRWLAICGLVTSTAGLLFFVVQVASFFADLHVG